MSTLTPTSGTSTPLSGGAPSAAKDFLPLPGQRAATTLAQMAHVEKGPGYSTPVFKGKEEQRAKVQASVAAQVSTSPSSVLARTSGEPRATARHVKDISSPHDVWCSFPWVRGRPDVPLALASRNRLHRSGPLCV